jgi:hypothetical protein
MGIACLLAGVWGGLVRLPLNLPLPGGNANWLTYHGPLMVCGFLGTVIGLERAVGLRAFWTYGAPLLTGAGATMILAGQMGSRPVLLITMGSFWFWVVSLWVIRLQAVNFTMVMSAGALAWATGNVLWLMNWPFNRVVPWWIGFLVLTILGERLDLSRFQKPSRWSAPMLRSALALLAGGIVLASCRQVPGERLTGIGLLSVAIWLAKFDIARRTLSRPGLPRFMAACLLIGYFWLAAAGILAFLYAPLQSGLRYDAVLHAVFVGFVFSMIFGHAPIIFPAVLGLQPAFRKSFYLHVLLLHAALLVRVGSDVCAWAPGRPWGGIGNAIAVVLFLLNTISSFLFPPKAARSPS